MRGAPARDPELTEEPDREAVGEPHPAPKGTAPEPKAEVHRTAATDDAAEGTEAQRAGGKAEDPASRDDEATAGPEDAPASAEGSALTALQAEGMGEAQGQAAHPFSPKTVV